MAEVHRLEGPVDFGHSCRTGRRRIPRMKVVVETVQHYLALDLVQDKGTVEHTQSLVYRPTRGVGIRQTRLLAVDWVVAHLIDLRA